MRGVREKEGELDSQCEVNYFLCTPHEIIHETRRMKRKKIIKSIFDSALVRGLATITADNERPWAQPLPSGLGTVLPR